MTDTEWMIWPDLVGLYERGLLVPPQRVRQALARYPDDLSLPEIPRWTDEALRSNASQWMDQLSETEYAFCAEALEASSQAAVGSLLARKQAAWKYQPGVEDLCAKYPDVPTLKQLLSNYYRLSGPAAKADAYARQILAEHPDYLFARVNLIEVACRQQDWEAAEALLNHPYEISDQDSQGKRVFHESEIRAFYGALCLLHLGRKRLLRALWALILVYEVSPEHPVTRDLASRLLKCPKAELKTLAGQLEPSRKLGKLSRRKP
jgi:hypothetical protein